jgi:polysaccharide pyruvyl transferase WcaK-like protein
MRAVLINTTFQLGHHGCTLVDRQLDQLSRAAGLEILAKLPLQADWEKLAPAGFDVVIVNGEGGLHHDSKAAKRIAHVPAWARTNGKPAYLINSVYEANSSEIAAGVEGYRSIFVRDEFSRDALAAADIKSRVVPDLTLTWMPDVPRGNGRAVVVTDSTLRTTNERLHRLARSLRVRFLPLMARPPRPAEANADNRRWRRYVTKRIAAGFLPAGLWRDRWRGLIPEFDDFVRWLGENAGLIVAGRFHGVCLALDLEIPVVAVASNTKKIEGVLAGAGLADRLVKDLDALQNRLGTEGIAAFAYSTDELERIRSFRKRARAEALSMLESIRAGTGGS